MRIAINGTGVAGPTLAWWLLHYGHHPVLFEKAPALRTGGYLIDFWGVGYTVAEKMGILPALRSKSYLVNTLRMVGRRGQTVASLNVRPFRTFTHDRFFSIARGDLVATIFEACPGAEQRFGESIVAIQQHAGDVTVHTSAGAVEQFDLVVGADGLHSQVRSLVFGPESHYEKPLGYHIAAFTLNGYEHRDELVFVSHTAPKRQVARVSLHNDQTMFLFVFRSELLTAPAATTADQKAALRAVFGTMRWETPDILRRLDQVDEFYFDGVSQIHMDHWTRGRVALLGDAAACVSFLAGEGIGLAMTEAYVLAGELHRARGDHAAAFQRYQSALHASLLEKQKSALGFAAFFAPKNALGLFLRNLAVNAASLPLFKDLILGRSIRRILHDDIELPDYAP